MPKDKQTLGIHFAVRESRRGMPGDTVGLSDYGTAEPCSECMCNRSTRPYTDLRDDAAWKPTEMMPLALCVARIRFDHPLILSLFLLVCFYSLDIMHKVDCNGVAALCDGGLLFVLVRLRALGPNQPSRLQVVNWEFGHVANGSPWCLQVSSSEA